MRMTNPPITRPMTSPLGELVADESGWEPESVVTVRSSSDDGVGAGSLLSDSDGSSLGSSSLVSPRSSPGCCGVSVSSPGPVGSSGTSTGSFGAGLSRLESSALPSALSLESAGSLPPSALVLPSSPSLAPSSAWPSSALSFGPSAPEPALAPVPPASVVASLLSPGSSVAESESEASFPGPFAEADAS